MSTQRKTFTGNNVEEILNWVDGIQVGATLGKDKWLQIPEHLSVTGENQRVDIDDTIVLDVDGNLCSVEKA